MSTQVIGEEKLLAQLADIAKAVQGDDLEEAAQAGADVVEAGAKGRVQERTRRLKDSIHTEVSKKTETLVEVDVAPDKKEFYGQFVEFGTSKMGAKPFMRPAIDENEDKVAEAVKTTLKSKIDGIGEGS
ncbi:MAG: HK97-gp10 family putative phage morphogenesis protein [Actinomycetota bacterium]